MQYPKTQSAMSHFNEITAVPNGAARDQQPNGDTASVTPKTPTVAAADSTGEEGAENKESRRPKNTALKQQRLPAWQPILTAKTVLPLFFAIGVVFVILGGVLLHFSNIVNEYVIDYTDCPSTSGTGTCSSISNPTTSCTCTINFKLSNDFQAPVYFYYGLTNYYQNHRRYVKSRDDNQLLGKTYTSVNSECTPYDSKANASGATIFYAPCGAIANSLFNDTLTLAYNGPSNAASTAVPVIKTGIAWTSDKTVKFQNPTSWAGTQQPVNWQKSVQNLDTDPSNTGYINEDLIVWMRTAALPSFRKFYRRVDHSAAPFTTSLPTSFYTLTVNYNYPTVGFGGRKMFVISTTTWIGGKNPFLGIAYLVVGSLCIVLGFVFLVVHFKFSRNVKQADDFNNNTNAATVATVDVQQHSL